MAGPVRVGLLGCGIVGGATARILTEQAPLLAQRAGVGIELKAVAVRNLSKPREIELDPDTATNDSWAVVKNPAVDIVVEVIGGIEPARDLILAAIDSGKHVVTANKELMSTLGNEILGAAERAGVDVLFEASVAGGIPLIRPMKESLAGERVRRVMGIVNGTTNFILTRMSETGETFGDALAEAQRLGYTELDPSADIEGFDAAAKLAILASIAFNARVVVGDVYREGISRVSPEDLAAAHELGYEVKLLAVAESHDGEVSARVHPSMVPRTHPLAAVRDVYNAVFIEGEETGELMFFGRGAGGGPTASAVVGDIVELARNLVVGARSIGCTCFNDRARIRPQELTPVRYYCVLAVADQPGVLSAVASVFAKHHISISSVRQEGIGDEATLVLITHTATDGAHQDTFRELQALESVRRIVSSLQVEGTGEQ
jgi:homoserine dehydrogenase